MHQVLKHKKGKIIAAAIALLLVAALITGGAVYREHSRYFCQYAKPFSYSEITGAQKPVLVAHRGAAVRAPENTLPAYEEAAALGYRYAETDIRVTKDGVWVLAHDASLKRMTGFNGIVEEMTLQQVQAHPITKGGHVKDYATIVTPTLEAFLALCAEKGLTPVLEIKTSPVQYPQAPYRDILTLVEVYGLADSAVIISFEKQALSLLRSYSRSIKQQLLVKRFDEAAFTAADELGNCGIDCEYKAVLKNPDLVQVAKSAGVPLNVWTVDNKQAAQALTDLGVDFITTNAIVN